MKVLIPCGGTRGDTQPCVALAVALRKAGHEVKFFAPTTHVKLCTDQGFATTEFKLDVEAYVEEILGNSDMKTFGAGVGFMKKSLEILGKPEVKEAMKAMMPSFWALAQEFKPDVIICARPFPALSICEKLRIPYVQITYQLIAPTKEYPPFMVNDGLPLTWFPSWHKWLGQTIWPLALQKALDTMAPNFETDVLQLPNPKKNQHIFLKLYEWVPTLVACEPEVLAKPSDYGPQIHLTGWWFLDENTDDFSPSPELVDFLQDTSRPPVVYVGFGSMKGNDSMSTGISRIALQALRAASVRGILLGGWSGLTRERLGDEPGDAELKAWAKDNVMELKAVPHTWLFPKVSAVCHHGGSGTTAIGLRSGKPTVIVPFIADQPYFAAQIEQRGLGRRGPHISKLSAQALAPLLSDVAANAGMQAKAASVGEAIRSRDSLGEALTYIDRFMKTYPYPWEVDCQDQSEAAARERRLAWPLDTTQDRCCCCCAPATILGFEPSKYKFGIE